jgi:hypothetical protein
VAHSTARHVLFAYGLAFLALVLMRGLGGGLFRDLKEITFVAPLVAVAAGASLDSLARRGGRSPRAALLLITVGLLAFTAERYRFYFTTYTSAVTRPAEGPGVNEPPGGAGAPRSR